MRSPRRLTLLPQVQLSLLSQLPLESGQIESCRELGVTPIGYSPLALGVLSGKYDEGTLSEGPRGLIFKALLPSCRPLLSTLREIAQARGELPCPPLIYLDLP